MTTMTESAKVRRINELCSGAGPCHLPQPLGLLKRANRYVGVHPSIGGQALDEEITEFIPATQRQEQQL